MSDYSNLQKVIYNKPERLYREFKDSQGNLINPTSPYVRVYDPNGTIVSSGTPTGESTGVYYFVASLGTAQPEGIYQAYWEGTVGGALITMDVPQFFWLTTAPWQVMPQDQIAQSVRRMIGDTNPNNYRIAIPDMYYFIQDAVNEVQSRMDFGYSLTVAPTSLTWNQPLYSIPAALFRLRTLILVMQSILHDDIYDGGNVEVGDIKIDINGILKMRMDNIKRLEDGYKELLYDIKMNSITGVNIDTHVTGLIINSINTQYWSFEWTI